MSNSTEPQCWGDILARCAGLDDSDWSLSAQQVREAAASIRDHEADTARRVEIDALEQEQELLTAARVLYEERDVQRLLAEAEQAVGNWEQAAHHALDMSRADNEADKLVHLSIKQKNIARRAGDRYEQLLEANRDYDRDVTGQEP